MFRDIPTQLITGFLGAGKTTAIRHLLRQRPDGERWAVLVNEFGRIGVDGALLDGEGVAIREVAGGCICCVTSQAFSVGLGRLIREARPDRILIEPSGLGHPRRLLEQLQATPWRDVLDLRATLTLVDARKLADSRYLEHPIFREQIELADVLLGSKADRYGETEREALLALAAKVEPPKARVAFLEQGRVDPAWLDLPRDPRRCSPGTAAAPSMVARPLIEHPGNEGLPPEQDADAAEWTLYEQRMEDYSALGWRIGADWHFEDRNLREWLQALPMERVKGLLRTTSGGLLYNRSGGDERLEPRPAPAVSRLELIDRARLPVEGLDRESRQWARRTTLPEEKANEMP